jgi:LacI family transcriptional regulator
MDTGHGLHAPTWEAVGGLLAGCPAIAAVYSVGGANEAILAAFEAAGRPCRVFIGHDLYLACLLVMQTHGVAHAVPVPTRSNVEVITPFNVPAHRRPEAGLNRP